MTDHDRQRLRAAQTAAERRAGILRLAGPVESPEDRLHLLSSAEWYYRDAPEADRWRE